MDTSAIKKYFDQQKTKVVELFDFATKKVKYSEKIKGWKIDKFLGDEEIVRAYILSHLVNDLGYNQENIELEKNYDIGRPKVNKPRIDIIVRDKNGDAFFFIELKSPQDYEKDKDEIIEKQLFNLASQERGQGKKVKYLTLYTFEIVNDEIRDKCILIDYEKFNSFESWREIRDYSDELPERYGKAQKEPYVRGGKKDLDTNFSHDQLDGLRKNLHNVLWGGGGTNDNEIFASLSRLILSKIQDESEKSKGQKYDFQIFSYKDGESFDSGNQLFMRINDLYRRALKERLNITDKDELDESYVIDKKKFSLNKLKYVISELERFSFIEGKNSVSGKDILGDFFEGIIREGFKQTKGQFFTHINVVKFMLWGLQLDKLVISRINNDQEVPYLIDPSAGSGTFLIEYMKFVTNIVKRRNSDQLDSSRKVKEFVEREFFPDNQENRWADKYIYGSEIDPDLGTSVKVNMVLHGDGSANIFVGSEKGDGLANFSKYVKASGINILNHKEEPTKIYSKNVNEKFDVIVTNPPFSVTLDKDTARNLRNIFVFGDKKNSENLFIERWYQLLKANGRFAAVLPESVFDTTENKYIRLFIYKYFKVKAVVSLPQLTFEPFTTTKTSLLFAQKKTDDEVKAWDELWRKYSNEWSSLSTRCLNLLAIYQDGKDRTKLKSVKDLKQNEEKALVKRMLKNFIEPLDDSLSIKTLIDKYSGELINLCKIDNETKDVFGFVNTWWVFGETAKQLNYKVFLADVDNIGYKRTKRGEKPRINELYRTNTDGEMMIDDNKLETALDYLRKINWE